MTDHDAHFKSIELRRQVLGDPYVDASLAGSDDFIPELLGHGVAFQVCTEADPDLALAGALDHPDDVVLIRVQLDPRDVSTAMRCVDAPFGCGGGRVGEELTAASTRGMGVATVEGAPIDSGLRWWATDDPAFLPVRRSAARESGEGPRRRSSDRESNARIRAREPSLECGGQRSPSDSGMSQAHIPALFRR